MNGKCLKEKDVIYNASVKRLDLRLRNILELMREQ